MQKQHKIVLMVVCLFKVFVENGNSEEMLQDSIPKILIKLTLDYLVRVARSVP